MIKQIVIVQPRGDAEKRNKAEAYVKGLGYEILDFSADDIIAIISKGPLENELHVGPFVVGATSILMAMAGNVCFTHDWKEISYCVDLFQLACKYGLNVVIMPED